MADQEPIHVLMGRVMADVGAVAKNDENRQQGFRFRGIDAVVNAVGPVLRKHAVFMVPIAEAPTVDHYTTKSGTQMAHAVLPVTFHFWGPAGDSVECRVIGEASDAGDKVLSKAHAVAWRVLECFAIPTDDPDPDGQSHERAAPAAVDWSALGWDDLTEYQAAMDACRSRSRSLPSKDQEQLRRWLADQGWVQPFTAAQMSGWEDEIDRLAGVDSGADDHEPGDPPSLPDPDDGAPFDDAA